MAVLDSAEPDKHSISYSPWTRNAPGGSCQIVSKDMVRARIFCAAHPAPLLLACGGSYQVHNECIVEWMNEWNTFCTLFVKLSSLFHWLLAFHVTGEVSLSAPSQCWVCVCVWCTTYPLTLVFPPCSLAHSIPLLFKVQFSSLQVLYSLSMEVTQRYSCMVSHTMYSCDTWMHICRTFSGAVKPHTYLPNG